ncbi:MAG: DUF1848 domain-containing protein [Kiloniellales bacterium]|nr:DUF1848 domain-containing protein [Kiloniellales bacterium]
MIISASYRTDIPAFYADWFLERLRAGFAQVRNPYGGGLQRMSLVPGDIDGFVFWTRNARPFRPALEAVAAACLPFVVHYTVTGYPRPLEASVVPWAQALDDMRWIARRFGPKSVVWRYDPLFFTSLTPAGWHRTTFARLAKALSEDKVTDEVVLSCATIYTKTKTNTERAARRHGFTWRDPEAEEKRALLEDLAGLAAGYGLKATLCAQPDLLVPGLAPASCIDAERLAAVAGRPIRARSKGNRPGCLCAESRDIGAYDTCPHGCVYCYAVRRPEIAKVRYREHDSGGESLIESLSAKAPRTRAARA